MNNLPLVSLIIPITHNSLFLRQSLESIVKQVYTNLEVIIIQTCKHPSINQQLTEFKDDCNKQKIKLIIDEAETDLSLADTLNKGVGVSSGEYIAFLDQEDEMAIDRIKIFIDHVLNSNLELGFSRIDLINQEGVSLPFNHPWKEWYQLNLFNLVFTPTIEMNFLSHNLAVTYGNLFFSRKVYDKAGPFENRSAISLAFLLKAMMFFETRLLEETLYFVRLYKESPEREELIENQDEQNMLVLNYLAAVDDKSPANKNAPSFEHWPSELLKIVSKLSDKYLKECIEKPLSQKKPSELLTALSAISIEDLSSKKLTLVTHDLQLGGGAPKLVLDLARYLKSNGAKVSVLSLKEGPLFKAFKEANIPISIIPLRLMNWSKKINKFTRLFWLLLTNIYLNFKTESTVIVNSAASWQTVVPFSLMSFGKKIFWYIHESYSPLVYIDTGLSKKLLKNCLKKSCFEFWYGSASTKVIWKHSLGVEGKVKYWSGQNSHSEVVPSTKPVKNLLAVGISTPRKGFHFLVDAFIAAVKDNLIPEDVTLTLIGFPDKLDSFNARIILKVISSKLKHRIHLLPCMSADQVDDYYLKADLFIQPSTLECMPLSLLQAMSMHIPVVTTRVNGCSEAIIDLKTGYLCDAFSSLSLKEALVKALSNPQQTREFASAAKKRFDDLFSLNATLPNIIKDLFVEKKSFSLLNLTQRFLSFFKRKDFASHNPQE
jgi:glycosyltransferase involved in cell wall biosynthesis